MPDIAASKVAQIILHGHEIERAEPELRGFLDTLTDEEGHALVAIMWVGRDTFAPDDFAEALATAQAEATLPTADYLLGTPHFPDHLEAGMDALGLSVRDEEADLL